MPWPSGPRWAMRSRIRATMSDPEPAVPGLNAPTMPHMVLSPHGWPLADDEAAPAAPHPVLVQPQFVDDRVADADLLRPPCFLFGEQAVPPVDLALEMFRDLGLRLLL